jgi:hypothetical protein
VVNPAARLSCNRPIASLLDMPRNLVASLCIFLRLSRSAADDEAAACEHGRGAAVRQTLTGAIPVAATKADPAEL